MIVSLGFSATLLFVACGGGSRSAESKATPPGVAPSGSQQRGVKANDELAFTPAQLVVGVGDTVEWTNVGDIPHTVTFSDSNIPSAKLLNGGEVFQATFRQRGTYSYVCKLHPGMEGTVTAQ